MRNLPGLSGKDSKLVLETLRRLEPFTRMSGWYLVGGLAIRKYLEGLGAAVPEGEFHGIDIALPHGFDSMRERSLSGLWLEDYFLIAHVHVENEYLFGAYAALVDRKTGVKINVFIQRHASLYEVYEIQDGVYVPVQSLAEQVVSLLEDLLKLDGTAPSPVDPKQFDYMQALISAIAGDEMIWWRVSDAWEARHPQEHSFAACYERAQSLRQRKPELIQPGLYTRPGRRARQLTRRCRECDVRGIYQITPPWRVAITMLRRRWGK